MACVGPVVENNTIDTPTLTINPTMEESEFFPNGQSQNSYGQVQDGLEIPSLLSLALRLLAG